MRRRSSSPAAMIRAREAARSSRRRCSSSRSRSLSTVSRTAAETALTRPGSSSSASSWTSAARWLPSASTSVTARPGPGSGARDARPLAPVYPPSSSDQGRSTRLGSWSARCSAVCSRAGSADSPSVAHHPDDGRTGRPGAAQPHHDRHRSERAGQHHEQEQVIGLEDRPGQLLADDLGVADLHGHRDAQRQHRAEHATARPAAASPAVECLADHEREQHRDDPRVGRLDRVEPPRIGDRDEPVLHAPAARAVRRDEEEQA